MLDAEVARKALCVFVANDKQQIHAWNIINRFIREVEVHQARNRIPQTPTLFKEKGS